MGSVSALVGLVHTTTRAMSTSRPKNEEPEKDTSKPVGGTINSDKDGKAQEPKTDLKAIIAQYGAVGAFDSR